MSSAKTSRMPAAASLSRAANNSLSAPSAGSLRRKRSRNLPLKFAGGVKPLLVKDVAEVQIGHASAPARQQHGGEEAVIGVAMMLMGENSRAVAERVQARSQEIQKQLPPGVEIKPRIQSKRISWIAPSTPSRKICSRARCWSWRCCCFSSATGVQRSSLRPRSRLSFLFALTGMVRFGISGNLMSLGAIDFGLIIDGAVVIVENIVRQLGQKQHQLGRALNREERLHTVLSASKQVGTPMFFGVFIIAIVYIPILALTGIEGKMFHPMALTVMLALGGA